jgi:nickel/cobalt exporter
MARTLPAMGRPRRYPAARRLAAIVAVASLVAAVALPSSVVAHPLGNFTINHYAGLRVEPDRVVLDLVIDQAEVPAFQSRLTLDTDDDGEVSAEELAAGRVTACETLLPDLTLTIDGRRAPLRLTDAGLSFPIGAGGLTTWRSVCIAEAALEPALTGDVPTTIEYGDRSFPERLGWREIVVTGSGATIARQGPGGPLREASLSERLTAYPEDRIASPLDDRAVAIVATSGGPLLPALVVPDASPVASPVAPAAEPPTAPASAVPAPAASAAVPGGIEGDLPSIFGATDRTPLVLVLSVLTALALGAGHALTPGHGKTLMAAYLVGTRGTPVHAVGLGLSVSLSHTIGILILAAIVVGAADQLPPDLVVRAAPVIAAVSILVIGAWMLTGEWRRRRAERAHARAHEHEADHAHSHGGVAHTHVSATGTTITWRSLFVLGLAGGLIPSTSALLILLGAIAAGQAGFGFVLVVAFGLGMAAVMGGIGLAIVLARERLDRVPTGPALGRLREAVPLVAAVLVFGFGVYLTVGAIGAAQVL